MYCCTLALPSLNWLIRVECHTLLVGSTATYRRTDTQGNEDSYSCPIGPDSHGVGIPTIAIIDLIKDLNFAEIDGAILVAHAGAIAQDDLNDILEQVRPAYAIRALATTGVRQ